MIPVLIALSAIPCSNQWPTSEQPAAPNNVVIWSSSARARESGSLELQREEDRDRVRFTAIEGRSFTRSGQIWQAFEPANPPVAAGCYQSDESGFPMCIGRDADDEEPIDPVLTATLSPKSYGTPGGNSGLMDDVPAIFMANCRGGGDRNGSLNLTIEADEPGPLLAMITVKEGGNVLREEGVFVEGQQQIKLDVNVQTKATIEAYFIDQAGQVGELASVEVNAPAASCSSAPTGLLMLLALAGLRRRFV